MNNLIAIICFVGFSLSFVYSQETSIDHEFGNNLILMEAGDQGSSNVIRLDNSESFGQSYLQYRFEFEQTNMGQIWDEWRVGLASYGPSREDFGIGTYNLVQDLVITRPSIIIERLDNYVGINTFDAEAQLHISHQDLNIQNGQQAALLLGATTVGTSHGYLTVNKPTNDQNTNIARFRDNNSSQVIINKASNTYQLEVFGDARANGVWATSDKRLKHDIKPIHAAIENINKLNPTSYNYLYEKEGFTHLPKTKQFGLLAQDLQNVFPNLVKESEHLTEDGESLGDFQSVNYTGLIPILIASIQELDEKIKLNTEENRNLINKNIELERRLATLEKRL